MYVAGIPGKQRLGRALEVDGYFRELVSQPLARTHIEGNSRPPPVIYAELHRDIGFGVRLRVHTRLLAIARNLDTIDPAWPILPANGPLGYLLHRHWANCTQYLHL